MYMVKWIDSTIKVEYFSMKFDDLKAENTNCIIF
jgi:hypothetical protein